MKLSFYVLSLVFSVTLGCSNSSQKDLEEPKKEENPPEVINDNDLNKNEEETNGDEENPNDSKNNSFKLLSLGDSYTIGQSVCNTCKFPEQLKDSILNTIENSTVSLTVLATTGWTTTNLKNAIAIEQENLDKNQDLVTLLIGVNNQYQRKPFSIFETEFPELVSSAIMHAGGDKKNVIVISIPDYAFTPFGNGDESISQDIDTYNNFIKTYCESISVSFVNITDITRLGLENTALVASDALHPSELAYSRFVERILPLALEKMGFYL